MLHYSNYSLKSQPNIIEMASLLKMYIDYHLKEQSPLKLILISAGAAYSIAQLQNFLTDPELCKSLTASFISEKSYQRVSNIFVVYSPIKAVTERTKRYIFSWIRIIPLVKKKVEEERLKAKNMMEEDMNKCTKSLSVYYQLPSNGRSVEEISKEASEYLELGK